MTTPATPLPAGEFPAEEFIDVFMSPHPFSAARLHKKAAAGQTVLDIAKAENAGLIPHMHVYIGGHYIAREFWGGVRPKAGTAVTIRVLPMGGGGGKNPLRAVLSLALMAASPAISAGIAGAFGAGTFLGRLATAGAGLLGRLALNALAPPARPRFSAQKESPALFIQGAQNRAVPFGRVPRVLGRHRFVPPFGALPYTETAGAEQYLRLLFVWGYGPLHIGDLKIGETPLEEFEGVEVETRQGYDDDPPLSLYSNSVLQNDLEIALRQQDGYVTRTTGADADEIGVDVTWPRGLVKFGGGGARHAATVRIEIQYAPAGTQDWSAGEGAFKPFAAREAALAAKPKAYKRQGQAHAVTRIDRVVLDMAGGGVSVLKGAEFRAGIDAGAPETPALPPGRIALARVERRSDDGDVVPAERIADERAEALAGVSFENPGDFLVAASAGENRVDIAAGGLRFPGIVVTAKQTAALRETVAFRVPKGQYDVRLRRVTPDAAGDGNVFDECAWTALRTVRHAYPVNMKGVALTALRIKATGQLSGVIERFNGVVTSILPDWDGEEWTEQQTSNPASLFRHVLQGSANARPLQDSRLDLEKITAWHENCAAEGREFNMAVDCDMSVREILHGIAAAGRAAPALTDGKWGVVEDRPQSVPVQHFTPRNTWGFEGRKEFAERPEALRVRFINRDRGHIQDERLVFDDGFDETTAAKYETLELPGVTSADQAWRDGRYHIATARLRPETYSFHCDVEHIVCTRGDLIRFSHDVPLFGLMSARVKSLVMAGGDAAGATLDAAVTMEGGKSYAVRFRKADGASLVIGLQNVPGSAQTVMFAAPAAPESAPAAGDLALFGEAGTESVELVVQSITPENNLCARLACVDAAPAVHAAGAGPIPAFSSQVSVPPEMRRPPAPEMAEIQSGEEALIRNTDGSLSTRIVVSLKAPAWPARLSVEAAIRARDETRFRPAETAAQAQNRLSIADVAEGETYDIQLRYVTDAGVFSPPLLIPAHRVAGTSALPSDVARLSVNVLGDTAHLSWDGVSDLDLSHYTLRYSPALEGAAWHAAVDIVSKIARGATAISVPAAPGSYLIKAVDVGGRASENAAVAVTAQAASGQNAILTLTESPHFAGARTRTAPGGGALQLAGNDTADDWADVDAVLNFDVGDAGLATDGMYEFAQTVDLGAVYASRLAAGIAVSGLDLNTTLDAWEDIDAVEVFDQDVDPSLWSLQLQLRATNDDPDASPAWSDWTPFVVGDYTARAFGFRALLASGVQNVTPSLSHLSVSVDMPDRIASGRGVAAEAAGTDVSFARPFRAAPAITVTPRDMAAGDYYAVTGQTPAGFSIRFFDSGGGGVARTFDYLARGYGEEA